MKDIKLYAITYSLIAAFLLAVFFIAESLHIGLLEDPSSLIRPGNILAALVSVFLLTSDVILPVPSSIVMILNGAVFGIALGFLISLVGSTGSFLLAFYIGRKGGPLIDRLASTREQHKADKLIERWGVVAIVITRPVPILAETTAIIAGTSRLRCTKVILAAFLGSIPASLLYAFAGAISASFSNLIIIFGLVLLIAGGFWLVGYWLNANRIRGAPPC